MNRILHIITSDEDNPNYYDIRQAYNENVELPFSKDGKLGQLNPQIGDIVYLYLTKPVAQLMYKCIVTDDNKDKNKTIDDSKYFKSKKYIKVEKENASPTCYMLKCLEPINSKLLDFDHIEAKMAEFKKELGIEVKKLTSFRGFTDKKEEYLRKTFDYIESVFTEERKNKKGNLTDEIDEIKQEFDGIFDEFKNISDKYKKGLIKQRIGQGKWRDYLIKYNGCKCVLCSVNIKDVLIASHIKEYSKCAPNTTEHLDIKNGLLLCANHDKLFDRHLISFKSNGDIIISDIIPKAQYEDLSINILKKIPTKLFNEKYMAFHRNKLKKT